MNQGFTLVELLVVVLIIGILSAVALPQYTTAVERSRSAEALTLLSAAQGGFERFRMQKDAWPADFTKIDVEIPTYQESSTTKYGGKNFQLTYSAPSDLTSSSASIVATRRLASGSGVYTITVALTDNSNGTITSTRTCASSESKGTEFCNAITGGATGGVF